MLTNRSFIAALVIALLAPATADAQRAVQVWTSARGMLGILTTPVPSSDPLARERVITEVVAGSAAERAGVLAGDTLLRVNGLAATSQVLSLPFEPGDTVTLRVLRDGRERDIPVIAAERPNTFTYTYTSAELLPDSVRGRLSVIMRAVRDGTDTVSYPQIFTARGIADSTLITELTARAGVLRLHSDSLRLYADSMRMGTDSLRALMLRGAFEFSHAWPARVAGDSALTRFITPDGMGVYSFGGDSLRVMRPADIFTAGFSVGLRAVAGAELTELNPGLAEYFGTTGGLLVLDARASTPAERAGLRPGDVVQQVNGTAVSSILELRRAIERARGEPVRLRVLRRGQTVDIVLED